MGSGVATHQNTVGQQRGQAYDSAEGYGKELRRQRAGGVQVQGLPTEFGPGRDHNDESGVAGCKPAETTMEADVAGFHHEHKRGGGKQPERGGDGMYVHDLGYGRLLLEVVVQIKAKADAHEDPEDGEPDQRSPAIFTRWPRRGCMDVHAALPPCQSEKRTTMGSM